MIFQCPKYCSAGLADSDQLIKRRGKVMSRFRAEQSLYIPSSSQSEPEHHGGLGARCSQDDGSWSERRGKIPRQHCTLLGTRDGRTSVQCVLKTRCTLETDTGAFIEGDGASTPERPTRVEDLWQVCYGKRGGCVLVDVEQLQSTYKIRTHSLQYQCRHGL